MQYYKNNEDKYHVFSGYLDDAMNGNEKQFSNAGCLMTGVAKIASQESGKEISLYDVNKQCDINKDGLLSYSEISSGLKNILGEDFAVTTDYWEDKLSIENFEDCSNKGDYVLAKALIDDVNENGLRDDYHWVLLEGYTTDDQGRLCFTYNGTSDNDAGRKYVYGTEDLKNNEYSINKIITVHMDKIN